MTLKVTCAFQNKFPKLTRQASTAVPEIPYWPKDSDNVTPYNILNLSNSDIRHDEKILKKNYRDMCKIYHPDLSANKVLRDYKGNMISSKEKEERFKIINDAYTLLNDSSKKSNYDLYKMGWKYSKNNFMRNSIYAHSRRYDTGDERFWNAGNWEDYSKMRNKYEGVGDEDYYAGSFIFRSELARKNRDVLMLLFGSVLLVSWMQVLYLLDQYDQEMALVDSNNYEARNNLLLSHINHGFGFDKWARFEFFLWIRRYSLYGNDPEKMSKQETKDKNLIDQLRLKSELKKAVPSESEKEN